MLSVPQITLVAKVKPRRMGRVLVRLGLIALLLILGYEVSRRLFGWNLHTVLPGRVYRGAQPTPAMIDVLSKEYGVRTIINLRGCGLPNDWYAKETEAVQRLGIEQEDICFSALRLPSSMELRRLVEVLDGANYPVYLHCRRGADRTGMAAVIVRILQSNEGEGEATLAEARKQLGLWYGHVPLGKTEVLDRFFDLYEAWLQKQGRRHDRLTFRHWLLEEYHGGWCSAQFEEFTPLPPNDDMTSSYVGTASPLNHPRKGEPVGYRVRVRNTGTEVWRIRAGPQSPIHMAYQVWDGMTLVAQGRAGMFDKEVAPGVSMSLTLVVNPLPRAGRFRLLVDMVEEDHCWFYQAGSEPHEEELVLGE